MTTGGRTTRRGFQRKLALVAASGLLSIGTTLSGSRSALAVSHLTWTITDATITSDDGSISELTFGDSEEEDDDGIQVSYEGLNDSPTDIAFEIWLRGTNQGVGGWVGGTNQTNWELLATGSVTVTQPTNEETYSWEEIFGEPTPVDVTDHSEIALEDFEAPQAATTTEQVLEVEIRALIPDDEDIIATATTTATISVTNPASIIRVGYVEGQFTPSTEADETVYMTTGDTNPVPADIDVATFDSATATINGAGGASADSAGGRGGRIVAEIDLSTVDRLRIWAAEGPTGRAGGWGGFNGGRGGSNNTGGGAGSSHLAIGSSIEQTILVADGGGGAGYGGGPTRPGQGGGGGARGGSGGSGSTTGNRGRAGAGSGFGGAGGNGPAIGTGTRGENGGQEAKTGLVALSIREQTTGGGNSGHADITLELTGEN